MEANKLITNEKTNPTQTYTFAYPPDELTLESGEKLGPITLAYETYGKLNTQKSNAILILHALSGDAHAAGPDGWWRTLSVKAKALTQTSTLSYAATLSAAARVQLVHLQSTRRLDKPYGLSFPLVSIGDMVEAQKKLIDHLGIEKLLAVVGGSMGGMQVLQWMVSYPDKNTLSNSYSNYS